MEAGAEPAEGGSRRRAWRQEPNLRTALFLSSTPKGVDLSFFFRSRWHRWAWWVLEGGTDQRPGQARQQSPG